MLKRMVSDQGCPGSSSAAAAAGGGDRPRVGAGGALFAVPRLLVGLAAKQRAADGGGGESERSPTSPLDPKALLLRSPRSPRTWDSEPVGLGLVVDANANSGPNPLLSPRLRLKSHCSSSAPKGCGGGGHSQPELGKTTTISCPAASAAGMSVPCSRFFRGDLKSGPEAATGAHSSSAKRHSFDLGKLPGPGPLSLPASTIGPGPRRFVASVSASEVEQSEDYTCIIARGPKTTHIFGDCILEPQAVAKSGGEAAAMEVEPGAAKYSSYLVVKCAAAEDAAEDFLSSCFACRKKLEGNDIYIYRGEKAFCSASCRDQQILIDEEAENNTTIGSPGSSCSSMHEDIFFMAGMVVAT